MKLINAAISDGPVIPDKLKGRIDIKTTIRLSPREIEALYNALFSLDIALRSDDALNPDDHITIVLFDSDIVSFEFEDQETFGNQVNLVFLPVHRWRARNLNIVQMTVCILEEFCHHFWDIRDEYLVTDKVYELLQYLWPNVPKSAFYNLRSLPYDTHR